jgi:uncharacterized membrane protein YidH (DUF202 family)
MDAEPSTEPADEPTHLSTSELAQQRTFLAAERTLFAVLRTGLAIAAGGSVIVSLLGEAWPAWVQVPLAAVFLIVGYYMMLQGLRRYRGIAKNVGRYGGQRLEIMPSKTMTAATVVLDVAITIVVVLFLLSAFE